MNNKLHKIKADLGGLISYGETPRRDQIVFTRARIGHTYVTHGSLLRGEDYPICMSCNTFITVEHILLQCVDYTDIRSRFFNSDSLRELLSRENMSKVVGFLREAGLYYSF